MLIPNQETPPQSPGADQNALIESRATRSSTNLTRTLYLFACCLHNVKTSKILRVLRIILVVMPEHPSDFLIIHNDDGNPSWAIIFQAHGRWHVRSLMDQWSVTTGKQQWEDSIWIDLVPGNGLTDTFAKTSHCAHPTFFSFLEHIESVYDFKQKYFWWKCDSCYKTLVVSQNLFTKWHASDLYKINFSSISEYKLFTDSLCRAVCFETFR